MDKELKSTLERFIDAFENVFDTDWAYTKEMLGVYNGTNEQRESEKKGDDDIIYIISPDGTFLNPKVDDETENWGYRGELLAAYRQLKHKI